MNAFEARADTERSVYPAHEGRLGTTMRAATNSHGGAAEYSHCAATSRNYCGGVVVVVVVSVCSLVGVVVVVVVSFSFFTFL